VEYCQFIEDRKLHMEKTINGKVKREFEQSEGEGEGAGEDEQECLNTAKKMKMTVEPPKACVSA
jgi:hypothetical protein